MAPADEPQDAPLRVSTLELFFDLVFAFTLTQLSALLDDNHISATSIVQALLVFGVLWWMYGGYAWLTNTRTPDRAPERLLLLVGMAGFLVAGLAIRNGFGNSRSRAAALARPVRVLLPAYPDTAGRGGTGRRGEADHRRGGGVPSGRPGRWPSAAARRCSWPATPRSAGCCILARRGRGWPLRCSRWPPRRSGPP